MIAKTSIPTATGRRSRAGAACLLFCTSAFAAGCEAQLGAPSAGSDDPTSDKFLPAIGWLDADATACGPQAPKYLRLTPAQYQASAEALLGPLSDSTDKLGRQLNLFERRYQVSIYEKDLTDLHVSDLFDVSEAMVAEASHERWDQLLDCVRFGSIESCAPDLVAEAGAVAFRRPLEANEVDRYVGFLADMVELGTAEQAVDELAAAWLMAPDFLHRRELGKNLDDFELASLVSYTLSDAPPDDELTGLAQEGLLSEPEVLGEQVRRLLSSPRTDSGLLSFVAQWLQLDGLDELAKNPELFPEWDEQLQKDMRHEAFLVAREVLIHDGGQPRDLLTADFTFVNQRLADLYGIEGDYGEDFQRMPLPDDRRGLLALSGFLARQAHADQTDIVHRGLFVRTEVLCTAVGAPPPNAAAVPPDVDEFSTQREELETVHSIDGCAVCHRMIDPLGYAFEDYDALGKFRSDENGHPIRDDGVVLGTSAGDLEFVGAGGLSEQLGQLDEVDPCLNAQFYSYVLGRKADQTDYCVLREAERARRQGSFVDGLVALFSADSERERKTSEGESQ